MTARSYLGNVKHRVALQLRSLAGNRPYRIPDRAQIVPASAEHQYPGDQYAQLEMATASPAGPQWTGVAVRIRDGGQDAYVGICKTSPGRSELTLCKRERGKLIRLGRTYRAGPVAEGTRLRLVALGSTIALTENGVIRIAAGDKSLSDGVPGVLVDTTGKTGRPSARRGPFRGLPPGPRRPRHRHLQRHLSDQLRRPPSAQGTAADQTKPRSTT